MDALRPNRKRYFAKIRMRNVSPLSRPRSLGHPAAMKTGKALAIAGGVALIIGGGFWIARETRAAECRGAAVTASTHFDSYGPQADAATALIRDDSRRKVSDCYRRGLLATPNG